MTIRRSFHLVYGALMLLAVALAVLGVLLFKNQKQFVASEENRFRSFVLAEELRQSGEHLTQFARAYVVTGDARFRQYFRDVIAIRNGEAPIPEHYERIYWDYLAAGRPFPRGYSPAVPLLALMRQAGVTGPEFAKLAQAEANSDALARREDSAMYARDGLYDDGTGHFTRRGPPDPALAIRLTHDQAYHNAIADVRIPIDEFFGMLDRRTAATVAVYSRRGSALLDAILGICAVMIALKLAMFVAARRRIWTPVAALQGQVQDVATDLERLAETTAGIARGERDRTSVVGAKPLRPRTTDEIGHLMQQHDDMIGRLQDTGSSIASLTARQTARFDQLFDQAPEAIVLLDAEDRVVRINAEFTRLFGYPPEEAVGQALNDLVVPDGVSDGATQTKVRSLRHTKTRVSFDVVRRRKDGSQLHVSVLGVPVDVTSAEIHGLAIYRDVTERIEAERDRRNAAAALLEARAELAHVTRATTMGEFAASIAHEVNQPLAAVVANADACRRWLGRSVPDLEEAKAALERISRDGKRASDVIAGMRSLLQRTPTEFAMLDLAGVVRDVLDLVGPEVARQRVVLQRSLAAGLPPVRGDRVQLQQVVLNLTTNAIQAMSGVTGRPRELRIALSRGDIDGAPALVVAVRDNGVGFAPDVGARLFAAFYTTKPDGLGMGLAISRSIVEAHGGRLWAAPNPDHGATFQFALPLGG
jgi:PAS domain S-box-containing protein